LRREPADDEGWVLLQLRCIKESAVAIAALIAGSRPFTILRVLGQPESDGLFARVTTPPSLPGPSEIGRPKEPWAAEPWPEDPFATDSPPEEAGVVKGKPKKSTPEKTTPERAVPNANTSEEAKPVGGASNGPSQDDTPPHGTARVEISPKWSSA
jgi:hypothetical protein